MPPRTVVLKRTKSELRAARRALEQMRAAGQVDPNAYVEAWQSLLDRLNKVWLMAEQESKGALEPVPSWLAGRRQVRKTDELLHYLQHARNVDQHTIQQVTMHSQVGIQLIMPPHSTWKIEVHREAGTLRIPAALSPTVLPPDFVLLPVKDRGIVYNPPTRHRDVELSANDPLSIGEKGVEFMAQFVEELEAILSLKGSGRT